MSVRLHRRVVVTIVGLMLLIGGCSNLPIEPTVAVLPTLIPSPTSRPTSTPTIHPPTATPLSSPTMTITPKPATAVLPTLPPTVTPALVAVVPLVATGSDPHTLTVSITEAQLNAALGRQFDAAPLPNYALAPRVTLTDGSLDLVSLILPLGTPVNTPNSPQTITLTTTLAVYDGVLESHPAALAPLNVGITTPQVKISEALLLKTLKEIVQQATKLNTITYSDVAIQPTGISITVNRTP